MDRVFGTVELLEVILLNLNCIELLRAKRISKHFCAVIDTSPAMRKSLWLDPPNVADEEVIRIPSLYGWISADEIRRSSCILCSSILTCRTPNCSETISTGVSATIRHQRVRTSISDHMKWTRNGHPNPRFQLPGRACPLSDAAPPSSCTSPILFNGRKMILNGCSL